jgi:hypothetical protein
VSAVSKAITHRDSASTTASRLIMGGLRPRGGKMGMSWCRLGDLFKESRMALCVVLGRFGAGDVQYVN